MNQRRQGTEQPGKREGGNHLNPKSLTGGPRGHAEGQQSTLVLETNNEKETGTRKQAKWWLQKVDRENDEKEGQPERDGETPSKEKQRNLRTKKKTRTA